MMFCREEIKGLEKKAILINGKMEQIGQIVIKKLSRYQTEIDSVRWMVDRILKDQSIYKDHFLNILSPCRYRLPSNT